MHNTPMAMHSLQEDSQKAEVVEPCIVVDQGLENCGEVLSSDEVLWSYMACLRYRQRWNKPGSNLVNGDRE